MRNIAVLALMILGINQSMCQEEVNVKKGRTVTLTYEAFETNSVEIRNKTEQRIDVNEEESVTRNWVKGFGPKSKVALEVAPWQLLLLSNNSEKDVDLTFNFLKRQTPKQDSITQMITFTLRNSSAKSIPLIIPDVMNPNLSPFSNSGVTLKVGQKIYYKKKNRKELLLVVDNSIANGDKIDVAALIARLERKK